MYRLLLVSLVAVLVACEAPSPNANANSLEPSEPSEPAVNPEPQEEPPPAEDPSAQPQKQVDGRQLMARLQEAANIMRAMRTAAIEAEERDGSECDKAFAGITAAVQASVEGTTELGHRPPSWQVAPRDQYMAMCSDLPRELQRCARFAYRMQNSDECNPLLEAATDGQKTLLNRMSSRVPRQGSPSE